MLRFSDIAAEKPTAQSAAERYREFHAALDAASLPEDRLRIIGDWDGYQRELGTWSSLVHLRFNQDTRDPAAKADREYADELGPRLTELSVAMKRRLLDSFRDELELAYGAQIVALWEADLLAFDPAIKDGLTQEAKLEAEYNELLASAKLAFADGEWTLSAMGRFHEDADRQVREGSQRVKWGWFAENAGTLDRIYGDLVALRHGMAEKLGYANFITLGYKRMSRIGYGREEVDAFREAVVEHAVPLAAEIKRAQAERLGIDPLMFWDDPVFDPAGNPKPQGDGPWMEDRAAEMFDAMGGGIGAFYTGMKGGGFMDLESRSGKAGGGFCTAFPSVGHPYIFANFNGTKGDVDVFTHEMGHAYQSFQSRKLPIIDYLWPTTEACEVHSMGLEYLCFPHMEKFFGEEADRYRKLHLAQAILFLPYGCAVDHFQHLVYDKPDASPDERKAMWQEMERLYLPWRNYGDLPHVAGGGFWQLQRHIYLNAFYYIDYCLALTCALQIWKLAESDRSAATAAYELLCARGGQLPFAEMVAEAGLRSPFSAGVLGEVLAEVRGAL